MGSALGKERVARGTLVTLGRKHKQVTAGHIPEMGCYSKSCGETLHRVKLGNSKVCFIYLKDHVD